VSADIFTGQIIATLIVLVFIAVFLLREWISQNVRPGVFEEGDPAIVAEREAEQERERQQQQQQRLREQARAAMEQRDIQLRRRQQAEAERLPRVREGDPQQLESSRRHPDQPTRDLPPRPLSQRAHELRAARGPQTAQPDLVALSSGDAAGPSNAMPSTVKDDRNTPYLQARQERLHAAEKRRVLALAGTSSGGDLQASRSQDNDAGPSIRAKGFDNVVSGSAKGKGRAIEPEESINQGAVPASAINEPTSILSALKQKRVAWGIPDAESWTLYDFERFEMTRFNIDLMFSPHGVVAEMDPWELIIQAEVDRPVAQDRPTSFASTRLASHALAAPDDWTERLGHAVDDASRWRARRRVLWERLREEAERDGLGTLQLPHELSGISLEELYVVQDGNSDWTPPPAPRLISRLPVLTALPPTPSYPSAPDDGLSLLSAHKRLRAEGSRTGRSFTISTASFTSPDDGDASSRRVRQRTHSQADTAPSSFLPTLGGNDNQPFSSTPQRPLPFPITATGPVSQELSSQHDGTTPSHQGALSLSPSASPTLQPSEPQLPSAISIPRRPPMPNTTIPTPTSGSPSLLHRGSRDSTPPASPSLATYQPPEEFQEGSTRRGYFDGVKEGGGEVDPYREIDLERFERDATLFFKDEPIVVQHPGKEFRPNAEDEEEDEEDEGDLPGLLADSDEDGEEDVRELRGAARRAQRRAGVWEPEWGDARREDVADEEDVAVEADEDGEDAEGEDADDAALAAQLADEDMVVEDDMEGALEGKESHI
jgi:hypothetical protein